MLQPLLVSQPRQTPVCTERKHVVWSHKSGTVVVIYVVEVLYPPITGGLHSVSRGTEAFLPGIRGGEKKVMADVVSQVEHERIPRYLCRAYDVLQLAVTRERLIKRVSGH